MSDKHMNNNIKLLTISTMCIIALTLSGCSSQVWDHYTKDSSAFHRDQNSCKADSYRVYPKPQPQQPTYSGSTTRCTGFGNSLNCTSTPNLNFASTFPGPDYSGISRSSYRESCMKGKGWFLVDKE